MEWIEDRLDVRPGERKDRAREAGDLTSAAAECLDLTAQLVKHPFGPREKLRRRASVGVEEQ
jgi:hypothetical protein